MARLFKIQGGKNPGDRLLHAVGGKSETTGIAYMLGNEKKIKRGELWFTWDQGSRA